MRVWLFGLEKGGTECLWALIRSFALGPRHPVQAGVLTFPETLLVCISAMSLLFFTEREKIIIIIIWVLSKLFSCT